MRRRQRPSACVSAPSPRLRHVAQEVVQGVMDRQRRLLGLGQAVKVGQHQGAAVAQVIIESSQREPSWSRYRGQPPPGQEEACGVGASLRDARVGRQLSQSVELGEEVADGLDEGPAMITVAPPAGASATEARAPEQGHRQLMDLVEQGLEAFVFGRPCADLGEEFFGDVDGAGLAVLLEGEMLAGMERVRRGDSGTPVGHSGRCIVQKWPPGPGRWWRVS